MKAQVKEILKEKGHLSMFSDSRYETIKELCKLAMTKDEWLKMYLSLDPLNKAEWIADHIVKFVTLGKI